MVKEIEGTYHQAKQQQEWNGYFYECNECGFSFMLDYDMVKCYCPNCGRYLLWDAAIKGVDYE